MNSATAVRCKDCGRKRRTYSDPATGQPLILPCKECVDRKHSAYQRAYAERNKELILARKRAWYQRNKERALAYSQDYRTRNKGSRTAYERAYRARNKEMLAAKHRNWRERLKADAIAWRQWFMNDQPPTDAPSMDGAS